MAEDQNQEAQGEEAQAAQEALKQEAPKQEAPKQEAPKQEAKAEQAPKQEARKDAAYTPRLKRDYNERIVSAMIERFGYKNRLEVPRLEKIVLKMGVGEATQDKKKVETAAAEMELIAGQKPVITKAK